MTTTVTLIGIDNENRLTWSAPEATPEQAREIVARLETVYQLAKPMHAEWSRRLLAARDAVLTAEGEDFDRLLAERSRIDAEWQASIRPQIADILRQHGFRGQVSSLQNERSIEQQVAHSALGGDSGHTSKFLMGGGIMSADRDGEDGGLRSTMMSALLTKL